MLRRDRLPNKLWCDLCSDDDYLEPTPARQACWLVATTLAFMLAVAACCWVLGAAESVAMVVCR